MKQHTLRRFSKATNLRPARSRGQLMLIAGLLSLLAACTQLERPRVEPFYAETVPPPKQELRWSNGKMPKSLDPARAAAAPETDIVRAIYEGLTDLDSKTLSETAGVAEKWESSDDLRTWTFHLRKDARWSNGERVTAQDFVRSWKRLAALGEKGANSHLYHNIVGMQAKASDSEEVPDEPIDFFHHSLSETEAQLPGDGPGDLPDPQPPPPVAPDENELTVPGKVEPAAGKGPRFGADAVDDLTLKVSLELPDKDFPKLVSNPIFRPVHGDGPGLVEPPLDAAAVTNGPFRIAKIGETEITLDRSDNYWNKRSVALERVRFIVSRTAEASLEAYRKGEIDIITNASFAPLALKLLTPYEDFRRVAHSALNFYAFNTARPPFDDRRVREALAIAIDRSKLTDGDLEGTTEPADRFFPIGEQSSEKLIFDGAKAKLLLEKAGYANGEGFRPIRLVVNRNETQQRVARSVARMWKQNLNLETVIIIKETADIDDVRRSGDFDLLRRGVVLPVNDEMVNLASILGSARKTGEKDVPETKPGEGPVNGTEKQRSLGQSEDVEETSPVATGESKVETGDIIVMLTQEDAIFELNAIPLYFPTSHALLKPYVRGFEINGLDSPSLKEVSIDSNWNAESR